MTKPLTVCIIQPFDPRGQKIGGIESHIRQTIRSCVANGIDVVLVGIDEIGDLKIGEPQPVDYDGFTFAFLPLLRRTGDDHLLAAKKLKNSLTLQFFFAFFKARSRIRALLRNRRVSLELQRFEYATFGRLLGVPTVQIVHGEGSKNQPMDSLIKKYWFAHRLNETVAFRVASRLVAVNPNIVERIKAEFPFAQNKTEMITVSVNTDIFSLAPAFPPSEVFSIGFAGRLDAFKRPDLMVAITRELARRLPGGFAFHYIGGSDPHQIEGFASVADAWVLHGSKPAREVAAILKTLHAGLLVSDFEGMPVFVLELLATGRPLLALELPQLRLVLDPGVGGVLVERGSDAENVAAVVDAALALREEIARGGLESAAIRAKVMPFGHERQQMKLLDLHRANARPA